MWNIDKLTLVPEEGVSFGSVVRAKAFDDYGNLMVTHSIIVAHLLHSAYLIAFSKVQDAQLQTVHLVSPSCLATW